MNTPRLFTSNRLEHLLEALAGVLRRPLSSPLLPEVIVVQSRGMERYLSMQLAVRFGIWANCRYPFPNAFVEELFRAVIPDAEKGSSFEPAVLTWRIMKELPSLIGEPGFEPLRLYLDGEENLKALQLSSAIADTFDQYLLFRPDMIFRWEKGEEDHWQARLWRRMSKGPEHCHRAARAREFASRLRHLRDGTVLPERVSVFGISTLPLFHMEILAALSRFAEVNLFVMNPCKEYWGALPPENPGLLSSLGRLGREFIDSVIDLGWEDHSFFDEPGDDTLLRSIQSDILFLRESEPVGEKRILAEGDRSVQFHACHGPMREVEVLRDQILDMLEADPELNPGGILVMTPDIRLYAPYIQAVFDIPKTDPTYIPFGIADRGVREESRVIDPFLSILDLAGSRFGASQVLGILEGHSVCKKFGLEERELEAIRGWVRETRIRWGIDDQGREDAGVPRFSENTWRAGLDRLLLGYALPGGDERLFGDTLPYDSIEGMEASILGRFVDFTESLFGWVNLLKGRRRLGEWAELLMKGVECFFDTEGEAEREIRLLRETISGLGRMESPEEAGYDGRVTVKAVRWHLAKNLEKEGFGTGFLTGGITFCAMLPMRSIPFEVLCLIGMNSDAYPRESHAPGFDLISEQPRPGDRSRRNDDRYLFLEALLSARKKLYVSFGGHSIQDNAAIPPSVLVSELLDYTERRFQCTHGSILDRLVTHHGLQAFSPRYFRGESGFFSYSEEHCEAARNLAGKRTPPTSFIGRGLSAPEEEYRSLDLLDLSHFYSNPCRFLLQKRLGLHLEEEATLPEDREPTEVKGLERYKLERTMLEWGLKGKDLGRLFPIIRASGQIPPGKVGRNLYEDLRAGVERFIGKTARHIRRDSIEPVTVDRRVGGFHLTGRIESIRPDELVLYRYARLRGSDHLRSWILHLALNAFAPDHYPRTTLVMGLEEKKGGGCTLCRFSPVEGGEAALEELLEIYWDGLTRPLHFFPESSWCYARELNMNQRDRSESVRRALRTWSGTEWERGECEDPYYRVCFGERDPLGREFEGLSVKILGPLQEHMNQEA